MKFNKYFDHTILKADATAEQVEKVCREAIEYDIASVCVNQYRTKMVADILRDTDVKVCTVVGFPLGAVSTAVKKYEAECAISDEEKRQACVLAEKAGADFVKTSTGFSTGGATPEDVALMRKTVGPDMGVKASGGIHTAEEAIACIHAGANRLGVSAGIAVVDGIKKE